MDEERRELIAAYKKTEKLFSQLKPKNKLKINLLISETLKEQQLQHQPQPDLRNSAKGNPC